MEETRSVCQPTSLDQAAENHDSQRLFVTRLAASVKKKERSRVLLILSWSLDARPPTLARRGLPSSNASGEYPCQSTSLPPLDCKEFRYSHQTGCYRTQLRMTRTIPERSRKYESPLCIWRRELIGVKVLRFLFDH